MKNRIICLLGAVMCLLLMMSAVSAQTESAGNVFISDSMTAAQTVERDLYWAGSSRGFSGYQVGKSFLAAGRDITVSESEIGGSARIAGYTITMNGVDVADNITAAGYDLQMSGITAAGVYCIGNSVYFSGTADSLFLAGNRVTLDGEIHGDAAVYGENIVLGENLKVDGTLTVQSETEPIVPSGAKIGSLDYQKTETIDDAEDVAEEGKSSAKSSGFRGFIRGLLGTLLLAALICLLLGSEELAKPGEMLRTRTLPMLAVGLAGFFVIPGIILILLLIGIGLPSAGLLGLLFATACLYSLTYAGVTLAKTVMPVITDNPILNNEWVCPLIGAAAFWLLRKIPVIGVILLAASVFYTLGYFLQSIFLRLRGDKPRKVKGAVDAPQGDVLETVAPAAEFETAAVTPEAEATEPEAEVTEPEPEATEPEAEVTEPEAEVTEPEAEIAEPEAEATESEPDTAAEEQTIPDFE